MGWYNYGARFYDPVIGRFTGVDPISAQFPHVSTYNYAENSPIGGIDLWGLQYVNSNDALFRIIQGQTFQDVGQYVSGTDANGQKYIGRGVPISKIQFSGKVENFIDKPGTQGFLKEAKKMHSTVSVRNVAGEWKTIHIGPKSSVPGKGGLVVAGLGLAIDTYNAIEGTRMFFGVDEKSRQLKYVDKAWSGVDEGIKQGLFTEEQLTLDNKSRVADYLYRGTPIKDEALQSVAKYISKNIF